MESADRQRRDAAGKTAFENIGRKLTPETKRMAGVALAALLTPTVLSMVDNQEETLGGSFASGLTSLGGVVGGGYLGLGDADMEQITDEYRVKDEINNLKRKSQEIMKREGPAAGAEYFARGKEKILEYIEPMDAGRGSAFNSYMREIPDIGPMIADLNIADRSPRHMRHMSQGAMLGALASAPFAYQALRGGEIEE